MLSVIIPRDLIIVPVSLDTLEMEVIALVMMCFYSLFVSLYMIEAYTSITGMLPRHSLWSSIPVLRSSIVAKTQCPQECMYVVLCLPLLVCPCCGCHNTSFDAFTSLCLTQCPATLIILSLFLQESFQGHPTRVSS